MSPPLPAPSSPPPSSPNKSPGSRFRRKTVSITAVEDEGEEVDGAVVGIIDPLDATSSHHNAYIVDTTSGSLERYDSGLDKYDAMGNEIVSTQQQQQHDDEIPGPPPEKQMQQVGRKETSQSRSRGGGGLFSVFRNTNDSQHKKLLQQQQQQQNGNNNRTTTTNIVNNVINNSTTRGGGADGAEEVDQLELSRTEHMNWSGGGILANRADLDMPASQFAAGCNLLQAAARGDWNTMGTLLLAENKKTNVNFRDYDRRTALHVAASEGHLSVCQKLIEHGAKVNRSDRWGGSPLDDAHRHRHSDIVKYLRGQGALTGSGNRATNLIKAAADGDLDEIQMLLNTSVHHGETASGSKPSGPSNNKVPVADLSMKKKIIFDVNQGDYDKRTALHLAAGEGHAGIVRVLCQAGANVNAEDRWHRRPLDDALSSEHKQCADILEEFGAKRGSRTKDTSGLLTDDSIGKSNKFKYDNDNMKVEFGELEMIDRIGAGAFGEIYKCRWRGTLVAAKIIKSAKIRREWLNKQMMDAIQKGTTDVDDAVKEMDTAEMEENEKDLAIADFRQEISVLRALRHPHIVLLLAYSTTENYECLISELMKCSLLDVFKSHMVQGTRMKPKTQIIYATQLSRGMQYLHSCKPPIIHRDLKPANLLIDPSGVLKISDFGLSKIRPNPGQSENDTFTMTGETGSYRFMAPEVFRHEEYNDRVDVYSYAMIFFYLVAGRPPWPTLPGMEAVKRASEMGDRPNIPRDLDARLSNLIKECWDDNPSVRPPFTVITKILTQYSQDVFKEMEDSIVAAPALQSDTRCDCVIL